MKTEDIILEQIKEFKVDNEKQHDRIMDRVYKINGQVAKNSEHRITWKAKIEVWKYLIGLLGISNVANLTYMWLTDFQR